MISHCIRVTMDFVLLISAALIHIQDHVIVVAYNGIDADSYRKDRGYSLILWNYSLLSGVKILARC